MYGFVKFCVYWFYVWKVNAQIFNAPAEFVMPTEAPTNEAKTEIETHPVTGEAKISKYSI